MDFQTVFADSQLLVSSTKCIRSWVRLIVLQKKNLNYSKFWTEKKSLEFFLYQKKWVRFSEFSCAHASDQRISKKMDLTHSLTHNAMSKIAHNHYRNFSSNLTSVLPDTCNFWAWIIITSSYLTPAVCTTVSYLTPSFKVLPNTCIWIKFCTVPVFTTVY